MNGANPILIADRAYLIKLANVVVPMLDKAIHFERSLGAFVLEIGGEGCLL